MESSDNELLLNGRQGANALVIMICLSISLMEEQYEKGAQLSCQSERWTNGNPAMSRSSS